MKLGGIEEIDDLSRIRHPGPTQWPDSVAPAGLNVRIKCSSPAGGQAASGEDRKGRDLLSLVEDARAIRNVLHNLHSRYNRKVIEQAAIAGVLSPGIIGNVETAEQSARHSRYHVCNIATNKPTVEFRAFAATLDCPMPPLTVFAPPR